MTDQYFLEMYNISKTFPGAKVLKNINLKIKRGEVHALIGENGAGKSTMIKILGGIYSKDSGQGVIKINGEEVTIESVQDAKDHGISIIHQEISLADNMTVADNLFMGEEIMRKGGFFINDSEMTQRAQTIVDEMGLDIDVTAKVGDLSIARQQMVEICRALMGKTSLVIMDEPTSSLTKTEIDQLFIQIEKLKAAGIAIIYISHKLEEIFQVADTITVLRDGEIIGSDDAKNLDRTTIITMMVGRKLSEAIKIDRKAKIGEECLRVENLKNEFLNDVSFTLHKGEILGFAGLVGAGRTELARAIFGIDKIDSGKIYVNGEKVDIRCALDAIDLGIGYVPENRKTEGLFLIDSIKYNISITVLEQFIKFIGVNRFKENALVDEFGHSLSIKMASADQKTQFLSGGNQQKVVLSKWLATKPKILILDEPTRGIDVGTKADIYHLIYELADSGVAIILISSEMEEIINTSSRIIVMHEGEITGELKNGNMRNVSQEQIMWLASGGEKLG